MKIYKEMTLIKNTGIIALGNFCTKIITFFLMPFYTMMLSTEEYGTADYFLTCVILLNIIVNLKLSESLFRFLTENRNDSYNSSRIISSVTFLSILLIGAFLIFFFIFYIVIDIPFKRYFPLSIVSNILFTLSQSSARGLGDNISYSFGNLLSATCIILFNIVLIYYFNYGALGMILGSSLGWIIGAIYLIYKLRLLRYINTSFFNLNAWKKYFSYSLPLVPNDLSWVMILASDRFIVTHFLGLAANGLITIASKFSGMYSTVFSIFNTAWTEQVILHYNDIDGKEFLQRVFDYSIRLFMSLNILVIAFIPFVFKLMVDIKYIEAYNLIALYLLSVSSNLFTGLVSPIYQVNQQTKKIANSTVLAAVINVSTHLTLIKYIGIYAAPVAAILGNYTVAFFRVYDIRKNFFRFYLSKSLIYSLVLTYIFLIGSYYSNNQLINFITLIYCCLYVLYLNKRLIKNLFAYIDKKYKLCNLIK